jgi:hypothetical protein
MLRPINMYFLDLNIGAVSTIRALRMVSMVPTTMFELVCSDTRGERICISRPWNISSV